MGSWAMSWDNSYKGLKEDDTSSSSEEESDLVKSSEILITTTHSTSQIVFTPVECYTSS